MISAEVSIYPLKTDQGSEVITGSIDNLNNRALYYSVGSISTYLEGEENEVWNGLKEMFEHARGGGEVSMVVTITNAADKQDSFEG